MCHGSVGDGEASALDIGGESGKEAEEDDEMAGTEG